MNTYVVDTNALLDAFLKRGQASDMQQILDQTQKSACLLWIPQIVFFECAWVLSSFYKKDKKFIVSLLRALLGIDNVMTENKGGMMSGLELFASSTGLSFSDAYIVAFARSKNPTRLITGDKKIAKIFG